MYEYNICNVYDQEIFKKQCKAIEKHIPNLTKENLLDDVDGSQIQIYLINGSSKIKVINDKMIGIEVHSDEELTKYFKR